LNLSDKHGKLPMMISEKHVFCAKRPAPAPWRRPPALWRRRWRIHDIAHLIAGGLAVQEHGYLA
jgi:hypothetical protein